MGVLAIHGGAGQLPRDADVTEQRHVLRQVAAAGLAMLRDGAAALDVVEELVVRLEECPLFNAGRGAVLSRDGRAELDAAIADGARRRCGAVAGVLHARNPVRLARAVMERSPHVLFIGEGADALARELGLECVDNAWFITEERFAQLKAAQQRGAILLDHDEDAAGGGFGTVGAVAMDAHGHLAAATSTGGLTNKHPGRVGDSAVFGAGTFADDRSVAVSCTGTGEAFIRACFGHALHARLTLAGQALADAAREVLAEVEGYGGHGGAIVLDRDGRVAMPFNSRAMFRAWTEDGRVRVAVGPDDAD